MSHLDNKYFELWEVLAEMVNSTRRLEVLWAFRDDGYKIKLEDIKGYYSSIGLDMVLKEMFLLYDGLLDKELVMEFGTEEDISFGSIVRYASPSDRYDNCELIDIVNGIEDDDLYGFKYFFLNINPESLDEDTMEEILNLIPDEAYVYAEKYLRLLPKNVRDELKERYF